MRVRTHLPWRSTYFWWMCTSANGSRRHFSEALLHCVTCQCCSSNSAQTAPFLTRSYSSSRTVWAAFAAHDKSWPVQWGGGAAYLYPSSVTATTTKSTFTRQGLPTAFKKKAQSWTRRCECPWCLLCVGFCWGFALFMTCLAPAIWSLFCCTLAWCVCVCVCTCVANG